MKVAFVAFSVSTAFWETASIKLQSFKEQPEMDCSQIQDDPMKWRYKAKCDTHIVCSEEDPKEIWDKGEKCSGGTKKWRTFVSYEDAKKDWNEAKNNHTAECAKTMKDAIDEAKVKRNEAKDIKEEKCQDWIAGKTNVDTEDGVVEDEETEHPVVEDEEGEDITDEDAPEYDDDEDEGKRKAKSSQSCDSQCRCCNEGNKKWCATCGPEGGKRRKCFSYNSAKEELDDTTLKATEDFDVCMHSVMQELYDDYLAERSSKLKEIQELVEQAKEDYTAYVAEAEANSDDLIYDFEK